jgi:hypothetical protein
MTGGRRPSGICASSGRADSKRWIMKSPIGALRKRIDEECKNIAERLEGQLILKYAFKVKAPANVEMGRSGSATLSKAFFSLTFASLSDSSKLFGI